MKVLTAAQIGCGKFAQSQDFPNMTAHPNVKLKWACDTNLEQAQMVAKQFNVPCTTADFMDVIRKLYTGKENFQSVKVAILSVFAQFMI